MSNENKKYISNLILTGLSSAMESHVAAKIHDDILNDVIDHVESAADKDFSDDDIKIGVGIVLSEKLYGYVA